MMSNRRVLRQESGVTLFEVPLPGNVAVGYSVQTEDQPWPKPPSDPADRAEAEAVYEAEVRRRKSMGVMV